MNGNNFALALTVGIEDLFTQHKKRIEKEAKKLEQDFKGLQKTAGDVTEFRRMQEGLEQLGRESGTTSREFQQQEQQLQQYASALRRAEVNISNLTQEQRRLNTQLKETEEAAKSIKSLGEGMDQLVGNVVAGGVAYAAAQRGLSTAQLEHQANFRTGKPAGFFSSSAERDWKNQAVRNIGVTEAEALAAREETIRLGVDDKTGRDMASRALALNRAMPNSDVQEILRATYQTQQAFGVKPEEASDLIYGVYTQAGDRSNDLLDTFNEYAPLVAELGLSAKQFSALLAEGMKGGAFNYDKIADGIKEAIKARFSDAGELSKVLGSGKTPGLIETIDDPKVRQQFKSFLGQYRQANENGGDKVTPFLNALQAGVELYSSDPNKAKPILEALFGTMFTEDVSLKSVQGVINGIKNPDATLGNYDGQLDKGLKESFSPFEDLTSSWEASTTRFYESVADFSSAISPLTGLLAKGLDKGGNFIAENPGTTLAGTAAAMLLGKGLVVGASRKARTTITGWFSGKEGAATKEAVEAMAKGAPAATATSNKMPSWMDHRLSGAPVPPPATSGGWLQSLKEGAGKALGGKGGKMLGWLPALLFGGAQIYDAAQNGDSDQLITTTAGVGGSLAGGAAGAYGGAALGTMILPGIGTGIGSIGGGILGAILGEEGVKAITEGVMGWFSDGKNGTQNDADKEMERLLQPMAKSATTSTPTTPPPVQIALSHQLAISVTPDFTNAADIEAAIIQAMRNSTPELVQELKDTLERVMQSMDYAQPSS
ncbi:MULTISPECIES: phage tail tape measure protein [Aeromonas]|uniref:phage tail tape measure protein n=1 Tax=Aeromonas TaxID=642 RepID=UPI000CDD0D17|nr:MULTISPECIES: phage tail tape measure protein [Aeromonas]AUZ76223.1 hypothetical protein C2U40_16175 [Aeromonas sp. ASNIH4]POU36285.1 hypothetical protein C3405_17610 [Aeromonas hydrophila]POV85916.1 hypothetical protein C3395_21700 [Aeromonas sp. ASNIH6]